MHNKERDENRERARLAQVGSGELRLAAQRRKGGAHGSPKGARGYTRKRKHAGREL